MTTRMNGFAKFPQPLSTGEETFMMHCACYHLTPEREYVFASPRKWRADFFFAPDLLVEVEGGTACGMSRHSRGDGFMNDARKYNEAALRGFRVLRFTTSMVQSGEAIDTVRAALGALRTSKGTAHDETSLAGR